MLNKLKRFIGSNEPVQHKSEEIEQQQYIQYAQELEQSLSRLEAGVHESCNTFLWTLLIIDCYRPIYRLSVVVCSTAKSTSQRQKLSLKTFILNKSQG